jgi:hypothetical protein
VDVDRETLLATKEEVVEDQDRKTPEEEQDVEGHLDALNPDPMNTDALKDDEDFEAHSLRDIDALNQDAMRGEEKNQDAL